MRLNLFVFAAALFASVHVIAAEAIPATTPQTDSKPAIDVDPKQAESPPITAASTQSPSPETMVYPQVNPNWTFDKIKVSRLKAYQTDKSPFEYALTQVDGKWKLLSDADQASKTYRDPKAEFEAIGFDPDKQTLYMIFKASCEKGRYKSTTECSCVRGLMAGERRSKGYNLCASSFKTPSVGVVEGLSAGIATLMFGLAGTTSIVYQIDADAILSAAKEVDLVNAINKTAYEGYRAGYKAAMNDFAKMKHFVDGLKRFKYDPDNLAPEAEKKLSELAYAAEDVKKAAWQKQYTESFAAAKTLAQLTTFIEKYGTNDPDQLVPKAQDQWKIADAAERKSGEEMRARNRESMRKIGVAICHRSSGIRSEYSGFVFAGKPAYVSKDGEIEMQGFVEDYRDDRIKISISGLRHKATRESRWEPLDTIDYKGNYVKIGIAIWDEIDLWEPC